LRFTFWTLAGGLMAAVAKQESKPAPPSRRQKRIARNEPIRNLAGVAGIAIVALVAFWWTTRLLVADKDVVDALRATDAGDVNTAKEEFDSALSARSDNAYRRMYGNEFGALAGSLVASGEEEPALVLFDIADDAYSYLPEFPHANAIADYAQTLGAKAPLEEGAADESLELYQTALALDPYNHQLAEEASAAALFHGADEIALEMLEDFPRTDEYAGLLGNLALAHARLGNEAEARAAIERALELDPVQPSAIAARDLLSER
jgi:tetratricopeptide (TPR) repeat protein